MKEYRPIKGNDINEFLLKKGIVLSDKISDEQIENNNIKAEVESIKDREMYDTQILINVDDTIFDGVITYPIRNKRNATESRVFDFSLDWIKFRCSKCPAVAELIKAMAEEGIKEKHEETAKKIEELQQQIEALKIEEKAEVEFYKRCIKIAQQNNANGKEKQ